MSNSERRGDASLLTLAEPWPRRRPIRGRVLFRRAYQAAGVRTHPVESVARQRELSPPCRVEPLDSQPRAMFY